MGSYIQISGNLFSSTTSHNSLLLFKNLDSHDVHTLDPEIEARKTVLYQFTEGQQIV